jgi:23S rRNA (uracil1939-C5)-methyltransferase
MQSYKIKKMSPSGHGITFDEKTEKEISILGAFPGDVVEIKIYKTVGNTHYGKIISFIEYSQERIFNPKSKPFFDANAPWKHLSQDAENTYKGQFIKELYGNDFEERKIKFAKVGQEIGYRNKVAYTFLDTQKGLRFALYTRGEEKARKVEQQENVLAHPLIEKTGKQFLNFLNQKNIKAKQLKYLILRYSFYEDAIVAYFLLPETNRKKLPFKKADLEKFIENNNKIKGILVAYSPAGVRSAFSEKSFYHIGDIEVKEKMLQKIYNYNPSLFFQINPISFTEILSDVRIYIEEKIKESYKLSALDLFAGVGIIGIELSDLFKKVTGVELSPLSKKYALLNAKNNNIENFDFIESNVDEALEYIEKNNVLIVDPPRSGLSKKTIQKIKENVPEYIFYISCNPYTQYRDFKMIEDLYKIDFLKMYNLFPKTHHMESLIVLRKKSE